MRNIYGLNYLGAATLDQAYQDKLKTFNGNSAEADAYFSGAEWAETLEGFKNNPDYNNSTELTMFRDVAEIKKYTYDIGQWHLDQKLPFLTVELNKVFIEALKKGNTDDTAPGQHPNPYPPEEKPAPYSGSGVSIRTPEPNFPPETPKWKSINTSGMPPADAVKVWRQEYIDALKSGDSERSDNAFRNLELARIEALNPQPFEDPIDRETRLLGEAGRRAAEAKKMLIKNGKVFGLGSDSPTFFTGNGNPFSQNEDEVAYDNFMSFGKGRKDSEAYQNYNRSIDILDQFPEHIRDQLDKGNEINTAINNSMTDETGKTLVTALLALADKMGVEIQFVEQ
jgi:hypothetical protein